jgi:hypothetical protein
MVSEVDNIRKCSNFFFFFFVAPEVYVQCLANDSLSTPPFEEKNGQASVCVWGEGVQMGLEILNDFSNFFLLIKVSFVLLVFSTFSIINETLQRLAKI